MVFEVRRNELKARECRGKKELEKLKESYRDIINERIQQINEYNVILDEETDIDLEKINFLDIPTNISAKELESIEFMVNME